MFLSKRHKIIPFDTQTKKEKGEGFFYKGQEYIHHSNLPINQTAFFRLSQPQTVIILLVFGIFLLGLILNWHTTIVVLVILLTFLYFSDLLFNLYLVYRSFSKPSEIHLTQQE